MVRNKTIVATCVYAALLLGSPRLYADNFGAPSRTMYKCVVNGVTNYSDMPCAGATRLDVVPTRGVDRLSGKQKIGMDVARERAREGDENARRPSNSDPKRYDSYSPRAQLPIASQQECLQLDQSIPRAEDDAHHAVQPILRDVLVHLSQMRQRYRELRC